MQYITFDESKPLDLILLGRIAIDFNPLDYYKTLAESETFKKYVGGSPANHCGGIVQAWQKMRFFCQGVR